MEKLTCEKCRVNFSHKSSLTKHIRYSCKVQRQEINDELMELREYKTKLEIEKKHTKDLANKLASKEAECKKFSNRCIELEKELAFKEGLTKHLEQQTSRFENHIFQENSKPRNITVNLAPYNLNPEVCKRICESYTTEHFRRGPDATYEFVLQNHLTDEGGRRRLACTDVARQIFKGTKEDGTEFTDVGGTRVLSDVVKPLKSAIRRAGDDLSKTLDDDGIESRKKSHYRALEPSRLGKRLAGDLR